MDFQLFRFSETELKKLIKKNLMVIIDTREQENKHITDYFDKENIMYIHQKMESGDYSFFLPAIPQLEISTNRYFDKKIIIERKANLEELSNNLTHKREQFLNEFDRAKDCDKYLLIEKGSFEDIWNQKFNTKINKKAFYSSLISLQIKYNLKINFVTKEVAGMSIYAFCYHYLKKLFQN